VFKKLKEDQTRQEIKLLLKQRPPDQRPGHRFTLWGGIIVLPLVLAYTAYSYTVFRGKVGKEKYYH
jgi:hypothetical protein